MPDSRLPPILSLPPALPDLSEEVTNQTALPPIPTAPLADLPPVPPALPEVPNTPVGGSVSQALSVLESSAGIGRRGFWLFAGACWATAMLSALWPINHLHTLARGGSPSASSHAYLQGLVDALSTSNAMPPVPTLLTGSWLGLTLVIAIAIAPVLMIAAVWQRHPFLPISRVRWLGMVPAVATLIGGFGMYWFSATITLDAHTLRAVSKDANMAHDLFGGNAPSRLGSLTVEARQVRSKFWMMAT